MTASDDPFDALIHAVCVRYGYCGSIQNDRPVHVHDFIPNAGDVTADQFVEWLFLAEGMTPDRQKDREALKDLFIKHMGAAVIPANQLTYKL